MIYFNLPNDKPFIRYFWKKMVINNGKRLPKTEAIESPDQSILLDPK